MMNKETHPLYPSFIDPRGKTIDQYQSSHYLEMYSILIGQRTQMKIKQTVSKGESLETMHIVPSPMVTNTKR